ncbi:DoxX family protein [Microlunatus speluncae]|uniref:DoxX family protein n=1 Tax=Microlunatus speluncae TaxID=2594267 RepID=UPI00126655E7|nr:DoxX family protein [Microlunatus speluncae]
MTSELTERPSPSWPVRIAWSAHLLLRLGLAVYLLVYGWSKVFLIQMGRADYGDALINYGEMSPMGLLWRMVGYSVPFQVLSGVAEVLAAALLLWRRTAGVGAVIAAFDMLFVFLLNQAYDVPVKQLSLALAIGATVAAIPYVSRFLRAGFGSGAIPRGPIPTIVTGRVGTVLNVITPVLAIAVIIASGVLFRLSFPMPTEGHPLAGVYRVTEDRAEPAAQLARDTRWQQVAFGQWIAGGKARATIRLANGDLLIGTVRDSGPDSVRIELDPPLRGDTRAPDDPATTLSLRWAPAPDGTVRLTGDDQDLVLTPDPERRFLFDRDYSWDAQRPVNR